MNIKTVPLSEVYGGDSNGIESSNKSPVTSLSELCKKFKKWGMYISLGHQPGVFPDSAEEYIKAAPYLRYPENENVLVNGFGFFIFDHKDDLEHAFDITVGDSGPTLWNDYLGPASVYALTCGPDGIEIDENTQA